jgi:hypothetical protein
MIIEAAVYTSRRKPRGKDQHRERETDKEQPQEDKAYNRAFATSRIVVKHTIGRVWRYASVTALDRQQRRGHHGRVATVAGLVNRQLREPMPYLTR